MMIRAPLFCLLITDSYKFTDVGVEQPENVNSLLFAIMMLFCGSLALQVWMMSDQDLAEMVQIAVEDLGQGDQTGKIFIKDHKALSDHHN